MLAANGFIYAVPLNSTTVLKIDPTNDTVSTFGSLPEGTKWFGGSLAANGSMYGSPFDSETILKIDPTNDTVSTFGELVGGDKWSGFVLAANGNIYGIPWDSTSIVKISNIGQQSASDNQVPSPLNNLPTSNYNKFHNKF